MAPIRESSRRVRSAFERGPDRRADRTAQESTRADESTPWPRCAADDHWARASPPCRLCGRMWAGGRPNVTVVTRRMAHRRTRRLYQSCKVHVLASWFEPQVSCRWKPRFAEQKSSAPTAATPASIFKATRGTAILRLDYSSRGLEAVRRAEKLSSPQSSARAVYMAIRGRGNRARLQDDARDPNRELTAVAKCLPADARVPLIVLNFNGAEVLGPCLGESRRRRRSPRRTHRRRQRLGRTRASTWFGRATPMSGWCASPRIASSSVSTMGFARLAENTSPS